MKKPTLLSAALLAATLANAQTAFVAEPALWLEERPRKRKSVFVDKSSMKVIMPDNTGRMQEEFPWRFGV